VEDEVGGACVTHGGGGKCTRNVGLESLNGKDHAEVLGVDGRIILKWILGK
jgi:hypothetical protein